MSLKDLAGIILIGVILFLSGMVDNPEGGKMLLGKMFGGLKEFARWLNNL